MKNDKDIFILEAQSSDLGAIANIYNEYILLGTATMEEELHDASMIAKWVAKFNGRERLYMCKKGEAIIGWGIIKKYSERKGYRFSCETAVYFTQTELRKGYGSMMKKFLMEKCKELDYHHLVAKIFASNTASIEYNLKLGYTIVGRQQEIGFKNGQWQDVVIMQCILARL